jgi:hypothetical protein
MALAILAGSAAAFAQTTSDVVLTRDELQLQRKKIVSANLELSESEAAAFWPVYSEWAADQRKVNDRLIEVLDAFVKEYGTLTDARAKDLLEDSLSVREARDELRRRYVKRFSKVLSGKQLARFYQIENKLDVLLDSLLAEAVPLVK